ncbi:MAG: hypothetical protein Q7U84_07145 [Polynucleobacter sp.]|nr:hypothetical protein [Polynucleobacter sp.]
MDAGGKAGTPCAAMQSHELLREVFKTTSAKQVAAELGLSLSLIYKWAETPESDAAGGGGNPLDRVDLLMKCSQDPRIIHWLCQRFGGFFIKNPRTHPAHPEYLIPATNEIVQEFADLLAVIAGAAGDSRIDTAESKNIRKRWEELKSVTETFVACCENGNFTGMKSARGPAVPSPSTAGS